MKTVYIGDIHGDYQFVKYINDNFKDYKKIFIGDIVDSFKFTRAEQLSSLELVIQMIEEGNTECLFGNHEMSYLHPNNFKCSGYAGTMQSLISPIRSKIWKLFKPFIYDKENKVLITHAGLNKQIWDIYNLSFDNLEEKLNEWWNYNLNDYFDKNNEYSPYHYIGLCRGGSNIVGGPLWNDWNDEFKSIEGLTQIFGHTAYLDIHKDTTYGIRTMDNNNFNIDCLQRMYQLLVKDEKNIFYFSTYELNINHNTTLL
jgi:hypothetical protein